MAALCNVKAPLDCRDTCDDITTKTWKAQTTQTRPPSCSASDPTPSRCAGRPRQWQYLSSLEATTGDQTGTLRRTSIRRIGTPPSEVPRGRVVSRSCAFHDMGTGILRRDRLGSPPGEFWTDGYQSHCSDDRPGD